jgi:SAM-dependent methyltransferase
MNQTLRWYNKLSIVHDLLSFRDWPYSQARKYAINALELQEGDTVVDLFCGTGVNFDLVIPQIGRAGRLIGVDGSPGMLARARWRVRRNRWDPNQIDLVEQDLLQADPGFLAGLLPGRCVPKVLITLALGIFASFEDIFGCVFAAMPAGTRFSIMEFYAKSKTGDSNSST